MTAAIAVELPPGDVAGPYADALLASCNVEMQQRAPCVLDRDAVTGERRLAVAIVSWKGTEKLEAHIEVGLRASGAAHWQARELVFTVADPEIERWRTLGFAIATLVEKAIAADDAEAPVPAQPVLSPNVSHEEIEVNAQPSPPRLWADLQFVVQSGAPDPARAVGGEVRFQRGLDAGRWFVGGSVRCSAQWLGVDQIHVLRPSVSAGGGIVLFHLGERARVEARLALALELIDVTGQDPLTGASDHATRWRGGPEQGIDLAWMWSRGLGAVAGAQVREGLTDTPIRVRGSEIARVPALEWVAAVGFRVAFP